MFTRSLLLPIALAAMHKEATATSMNSDDLQWYKFDMMNDWNLYYKEDCSLQIYKKRSMLHFEDQLVFASDD